MIRIEQGKGCKDRYTALSEHLLHELRAYWVEYSPKYWLFPGQKPGNHITNVSVSQILYDAKKNRFNQRVQPAPLLRLRPLHVLPSGFTKIRYYGFLAHANKKTCIELIRTLIGTTIDYAKNLVEDIQEMMLRLTCINIYCCPQCGKGKLVYLRPIGRPAYDDTS